MIITCDSALAPGLHKPCSFSKDHSTIRIKQVRRCLKEAFEACVGAAAVASNQCISNMHSEAPAAFLYQNRLYINPSYKIHQYAMVIPTTEMCLSDPGVEHIVDRANLIYFTYSLVKGDKLVEYTRLERGYDAQVIQHECDHLQGKTIFKRFTHTENN